MAGLRKRILLVEEEPDLAEVIAFRLELHGYEVTTLPSAEDALLRAPEIRPDLVLTDLVLPGMDGVALIEQLALDEKTATIPVIVLSVDADLDCVQNAHNAGATDFVVVPFHPQVLEEKVAKHLANVRVKKPEGATETQSGGGLAKRFAWVGARAGG